MPVFSYKAITRGGAFVEGTMDAADQSGVLKHLYDQGHTPLRAEEISRSSHPDWLHRDIFVRKRIVARDLGLLTRELASLLRAGLTIERSLAILVDLSPSPRIRTLLQKTLEHLRNGGTLADAIASHDSAFPDYYVNMVRAGESAGALETVLERLADYIERSRKVTETIRSALIYPVILLVMAGAAIVLLLTVVLPEFRPIFNDAGAALPASTRAVLALADGIQDHWEKLALIPVLAVLFAYWQRATPDRRYRSDRLILAIPVVGPLVSKVETARFARGLGTLLANGVVLLTALGIVKGALTNAVLGRAVQQAEERLAQGEGLAKPLDASGAFPPLTSQLIRIGEETGQLDEMLLHIANICDDQVQRTLERLLAMLVPALTIGLGLFIAAIIISVLTAIVSVNRLVI